MDKDEQSRHIQHGYEAAIAKKFSKLTIDCQIYCEALNVIYNDSKTPPHIKQLIEITFKHAPV